VWRGGNGCYDGRRHYYIIFYCGSVNIINGLGAFIISQDPDLVITQPESLVICARITRFDAYIGIKSSNGDKMQQLCRF